MTTRKSKIPEARWSELFKNPDWYVSFVPESRAIIDSWPTVEERRRLVREEIYPLFEQLLKEGGIALGDEEGIWDADRKPTDVIVIHHTAGKPGLTPERLSAMELFRLYAEYYANQYENRGIITVGTPISSGHVRGGRQVFYPYHWLVRMDGSVEQLLHDDEVGWHAGNWDINCRSVAIALDNNYENSIPDKTVLRAIADLIRSRYSHIPKERIFGHREVKRTVPGETTCPGNQFLPHDDYPGWKKTLLDLI